MPKYWGEIIFSLGSFPEVGQKQKTEKKERKRKKERRAKVGNNNGQLRIANATSGQKMTILTTYFLFEMPDGSRKQIFSTD